MTVPSNPLNKFGVVVVGIVLLFIVIVVSLIA